VRAFKEHVQRGSPYVFDYDDLLNQVKVYEQILNLLNSLGRCAADVHDKTR